jgi:hypothetical protein
VIRKEVLIWLVFIDMANIVKYNLSTSPNSIQSGNFNIGVSNTPTDLTGFYNGICPINGGYTIYIDKTSNGPSIYAPKNDEELIGITNRLGGNVTTAGDALVWITSQSNMTVLNSNYPPILTSGITLNLDASFVSSYPISGTTWYDLSGNDYNGSTTEGVSYDSRVPGYLVLNGSGGNIENIGTTSSFSFIQNTGVFTITALVRPTDFTAEGSLISNTRNLNEKGFSLGCGGTVGGVSVLDFKIDNGSGYIVDNQVVDIFTNNDWVVLTIVGNGSSVLYYKNTNSIDGFSISGTLATGNSARILTVGGANVLTNDWDGDISQVLIYNRALTQEEIETNYNAILNKFIPRDNLILSLDAQNTNLYAVSPTTAYDISGNGYNGPLTNGVQYVADGNGSWLFDGVNDDIDFVGFADTFSFIQNTGIFTICAWVKVDDTTTTQRAIMGNNRNVTTEKGFLLGKGTDADRIRFVMTNGTGTVYSQNIDNYFLDSNWVFVTIVGNGANVIYYKNGSLFTTGSAIGTLSTGSSNRSLVIGGMAGAVTTLFWKGSISQTSIYDYALTSTEISTIYNATKTRYGL